MYQHGGDIYTNRNLIDFSANINFMGMPESVKEAAEKAISDSVHYPDVRCMELRQAIGTMEHVNEEHIFCGNGAADVIFSLVLAKKPKKALLPVPSFYEYQQALNSICSKTEVYQMQEKNGFRLEEDILNKITPDIDLLFLSNPGNPAGILTSRDLLEKILHKCERTDTLMVVDECFLDLTDDPDAYTMMPWVERSDQVFILKSFTKIYAMPGLRLGYGVCCNGGLLDQMERVSQPWRVSVPAQVAGVAATAETEYVKKSRREIGRLREQMKSAIRDMGYMVADSAANYVFFEGEYHLGNLMKERGILIRDCSNYQGLHMGFYRVAVRSGAENEKFLDALGEIHLG